MKKGEVWEEYTNQVISVTDGFPDCNNGSLGMLVRRGDLAINSGHDWTKRRQKWSSHFVNPVRLPSCECKKKSGVEPMFRNLFVATAFVAFTCLVAAPATAQFGQGNSANNLFSQYVTPDGPNMTTAGMYPAPHYSPMMGAQSYYTYQPLMPHEMMYQHSRNYYNYYNTGGYFGGNDSVNVTKVRWQSGANHMAPLRFSTPLSGLTYKFQKRRYNLDQDCYGDCDGSGRGCRGCRRCGSGDCGCASGTDCGVSNSDCASGGCVANLSDESLSR